MRVVTSAFPIPRVSVRKRQVGPFKSDDNRAGSRVVDDELDFGSAVVGMLEGEA